MVFITILTGAYKPTYNWGASHCSYGAPHFYTLTTITVQLVPLLSTKNQWTKVANDIKLWKQGAQVRNAFPSATSESGARDRTQVHRNEAWNNTDSDIHRERTECAACAKKSCAPDQTPQAVENAATYAAGTLPHYCTRCKCFNML